MKYILTICIWMVCFFSISQNVEGVWNTYNSAGEVKSEVEIYIKDGKLYGKLVKLHKVAKAKSDAKCVKCKV